MVREVDEIDDRRRRCTFTSTVSSLSREYSTKESPAWALQALLVDAPETAIISLPALQYSTTLRETVGFDSGARGIPTSSPCDSTYGFSRRPNANYRWFSTSLMEHSARV